MTNTIFPNFPQRYRILDHTHYQLGGKVFQDVDNSTFSFRYQWESFDEYYTPPYSHSRIEECTYLIDRGEGPISHPTQFVWYDGSILTEEEVKNHLIANGVSDQFSVYQGYHMTWSSNAQPDSVKRGTLLGFDDVDSAVQFKLRFC